MPVLDTTPGESSPIVVPIRAEKLRDNVVSYFGDAVRKNVALCPIRRKMLGQRRANDFDSADKSTACVPRAHSSGYRCRCFGPDVSTHGTVDGFGCYDLDLTINQRCIDQNMRLHPRQMGTCGNKMVHRDLANAMMLEK